MFLRHVAFRRAVDPLRINLIATSGGRVFSSGSRCAEARQQPRTEGSLIRKTFGHTDVADLRSKGTRPVPRIRGNDTSGLITEEEYNKWLRDPVNGSYPDSLCGLKLKSLQAEQRGARLPKHLRRDPLSAFTHESDALHLSVTTAGDCLQLYIYRLLEKNLGDDELVRRLRTGELGWEEL
jgi:hypothetical protein